MRRNQPAKRKKKRLLYRVVTLAVTAAILYGAYVWLQPYLQAERAVHYDSYTVSRGDVYTTKSFSATLSVADSETHYNTTGAESVKKLHVTGGQEVREGDVLMELSDGTTLAAGMDGVVNEIRYAEGDWLRSGVQLVEVCDLTHLQVALQIDEYDVEQVSVGEACTVTVVPLDLAFDTVLTHVSRLSSSTGRVAYYSATASLTVPEEVLPGMTVSVSIPAEKAEDALILPMAALSFEADGTAYVLSRGDTGAAHIPVITGLSDGMQVEILSGVAEGDVVWVEAGAEEVEPSLSLMAIYKAIFGERVVINEPRDSASRTERGDIPSGDDAAQQGWGAFDPSTLATGTDMPFPEGGDFPGNSGKPSRGNGAWQQGTATGTDMPFPDGGDIPGSSGKPSRSNGERQQGTETESDATGGQRTERSGDQERQKRSDGE